MIRSLKTQILFVITLLVLMLVVQVLLSHTSQSTLVENQHTVSRSFSLFGLAHELERDVIDLQRHLLIYKETASDSSVARFYELMDRVDFKLESLINHADHNSSIELESAVIVSMRGHLKDYKENFSSVIDGRSQRRSLTEERLQPNFKKLDVVFNNIEKGVKTPREKYHVMKLRYYISVSERLINQYLIYPDAEIIEQFKDMLFAANELSGKHFNDNAEIRVLLKMLKDDFNKLTHISRGYVFLVNVVMAGSANEFLYLTKKLREMVITTQETMSENAELSADSTQRNTGILSIVFITISIMAAWFLTQRIVNPIRNITEVFRKLTIGEEIVEVPWQKRNDEIGDLAKAADIFQYKNKQTSELLDSAQQMNTKQELLNIELSREKNKAEEAAKSKSMFLANMSHEIRTPMNGIIGLVDLLFKTQLSDIQEQYLKKISFSGQIMMNVINDILDFSKIEAGKMDIESVEFQVGDIIENIISGMQVRLVDKDIKFRVLTLPGVPKALSGDPLRISQVLLNLCGNAVKFTNAGMIRLIFDYKKTATAEYLEVEVMDTGIGMSPYQLDNIFKSFTQADGTTSRKYGGTGLGLTIVKQLVGLMGGHVSVTSAEDEGSCFKVSMKVKSVSEVKAIEPVESDSSALYYLSQGQPAFIDEQEFISIDKKPEFVGWQELAERVINSSPHVILLIDVPDSLYLKERADEIRKILNHGHSVAFITDLNSGNLSSELYYKWKVPVLCHPYSPAVFNSFFSLLYKREVSQPASIESGEENKTSFNGHILLVEDNEVNQLVAGQMISLFGLTYDVAENGMRAVDMVVNGGDYDLVFMDIQMPVMDGYEATREIRKKGYTNLIICGLSANAMADDYKKAESAGMNDYLTKPLYSDAMQGILVKYL